MLHEIPARWTATTVAAVLMLSIWTPTVDAGAAGSRTPAPALHLPHPFPRGYFEYTAQPGASIADEVIVANVGNVGGVLLVYASDGITSPATGIVYAPRQQP